LSTENDSLKYRITITSKIIKKPSVTQLCTYSNNFNKYNFN